MYTRFKCLSLFKELDVAIYIFRNNCIVRLNLRAINFSQLYSFDDSSTAILFSLYKVQLKWLANILNVFLALNVASTMVRVCQSLENLQPLECHCFPE
jgi:hypothetical protein